MKKPKRLSLLALVLASLFSASSQAGSFSVTPVRFFCPCTRDRSVAALKLLGRGELESILQEDGKAELTCHFCNSVYTVEHRELEELIGEFEATAPLR